MLTGRLSCPTDVAIDLAALALQCRFILNIALRIRFIAVDSFMCFSAELGDYDPAEHTPALISQYRFIPEQSEEVELAILEKFKTCKSVIFLNSCCI